MVALELVAPEIEGLGGEIEWLDVTAEHPFWVRGEGWIEAGDLLPGDELFTSAGGWARVSGSTWAEVEAAVYNLDVEGWDSYFVGEGGYWVHNADCPQGLAAGGAGRLTSIGSGQWRSSAGLVDGQGSVHGNRVRHVLAHAAPDASKPADSVFNVARNRVLGLVDEAWAARGSHTIHPGSGNRSYRVDMGRVWAG